MNLRKILVPTDFNEKSDDVLKSAIGLAKNYDAELIIVHIISTDIYISSFYASAVNMPNLLNEVAQEAQAHMENFIKDFDLEGIKHSVSVVEGNITSVILEKSEQEDIDLIIMGSHGRTGIERFILGSNSEKVIRNAHCNVLIIK